MAENDSGELWKHIGDLHRKHSELAIKLHDRMHEDGEAGQSALDGHLGAIHETLKEILAVIKQDLAEDKGEKGKEDGGRGRNGRGSAAGSTRSAEKGS